MSLDKYVNTDLNPFARDFCVHFKCWNRQQLLQSDPKPQCPSSPGYRAELYWDALGFRRLGWMEREFRGFNPGEFDALH